MNRHLYGGLAQQEPTDETGIMCRLRRLAAKRDDTTYPGQYDNENVGSRRMTPSLKGAAADTFAELESTRAMDRATDPKTTPGNQHIVHYGGYRGLYHRDSILYQVTKAVMSDTRVSAYSRSSGAARLIVSIACSMSLATRPLAQDTSWGSTHAGFLGHKTSTPLSKYRPQTRFACP
jgi:hypothetical protein